jgi:hypothetical protein
VTIAVTAGDPCGIGPELILKTLPVLRSHRAIIIGDLSVFARAARVLKHPLPGWRVVRKLTEAPDTAGLVFLDCASRGTFASPGRAFGATSGTSKIATRIPDSTIASASVEHRWPAPPITAATLPRRLKRWSSVAAGDRARVPPPTWRGWAKGVP